MTKQIKTKISKNFLLFTLSFSLIVFPTLLIAEFLRDNIKEIVLDTSTNLIWQDDNTPATITWKNAISHCENLSLGGYNDWRLPNFNELNSLADRSTYKPAISSVFQNVFSSNYWSSTTRESFPSHAWVVDFYNGHDDWDNKTFSDYVRCVRSSDN